MERDKQRLDLLRQMPKQGVCAEVGVWNGWFSAKILEIAQPKQLHLIDPWVFQPEFDNSNFGKEAHRPKIDKKYDQVKRKFKDDARVVIHRMMSDEALASFEDASLDWIYIDGNHNFDVVSEDLRLALKKVKPNGIIAGDDLGWGQEHGLPVTRAVNALRTQLGSAVSFENRGDQYILRLHRTANNAAEPSAA